MPSWDEIMDAEQEIRKWYLNYLLKSHAPHSAQRLMEVTPYETMREKFLKDTGTYSGPYSPY